MYDKYIDRCVLLLVSLVVKSRFQSLWCSWVVSLMVENQIFTHESNYKYEMYPLLCSRGLRIHQLRKHFNKPIRPISIPIYISKEVIKLFRLLNDIPLFTKV